MIDTENIPYTIGYVKTHDGSVNLDLNEINYYPDSNTESEDCYKFVDKYGIPNLDIAQFGVYVGCTLKRLLDGADSVNKPYRKVYALDSFFGGLPRETEGISVHHSWNEGCLDLGKDRNLNNIEEVKNFLNNVLDNRSNINYVVGYYKDSLTEELANSVGKEQLSFVDIDCDIHSSSVEVLDFLFTYRVMCIGCIIRFDDFMGTAWDAGQRLAVLQATNKYKFTIKNLSDNVFILEKY